MRRTRYREEQRNSAKPRPTNKGAKPQPRTPAPEPTVPATPEGNQRPKPARQPAARPKGDALTRRVPGNLKIQLSAFVAFNREFVAPLDASAG